MCKPSDDLGGLVCDAGSSYEVPLAAERNGELTGANTTRGMRHNIELSQQFAGDMGDGEEP